MFSFIGPALAELYRQRAQRQRSRQQRLEADSQVVAVGDGNSTTFDVPPLRDAAETIMVCEMVMSADVQRWMMASGPVDIIHEATTASYRLTGPNVSRRLQHAVACAGERPLMESDIITMTTAEAVERDARERAGQLRNALPDTVAEMRHAQERARRRMAAPPLLTYPGAVNWFPEIGLIPRRLGIEERDNLEEVDRKAKAALWRYLTDQQHEDLFCLGHFMVKGGKSKMGYKILKGRQGNVHRDDDARFCLTHGDLPVWDLMLAQKLMIQDNEPQFLELANDLGEIPF